MGGEIHSNEQQLFYSPHSPSPFFHLIGLLILPAHVVPAVDRASTFTIALTRNKQGVDFFQRGKGVPMNRQIRTIDCHYIRAGIAASFLAHEGGEGYFVEANTRHAGLGCKITSQLFSGYYSLNSPAKSMTQTVPNPGWGPHAAPALANAREKMFFLCPRSGTPSSIMRFMTTCLASSGP